MKRVVGDFGFVLEIGVVDNYLSGCLFDFVLVQESLCEWFCVGDWSFLKEFWCKNEGVIHLDDDMATGNKLYTTRLCIYTTRKGFIMIV